MADAGVLLMVVRIDVPASDVLIPSAVLDSPVE
jgi:hypothetical protein